MAYTPPGQRSGRIPAYRRRPELRLDLLKAAVRIPALTLVVICLVLLLLPVEVPAVSPGLPAGCGAPIRIVNQSWLNIPEDDTAAVTALNRLRKQECNEAAIGRIAASLVLAGVVALTFFLMKASQVKSVARFQQERE